MQARARIALWLVEYNTRNSAFLSKYDRFKARRQEKIVCLPFQSNQNLSKRVKSVLRLVFNEEYVG